MLDDPDPVESLTATIKILRFSFFALSATSSQNFAAVTSNVSESFSVLKKSSHIFLFKEYGGPSGL